MLPLDFELRGAGSCAHPEHVILKNRRLRPLVLPATYAIIEHPKEGITLFDTGYGSAFFRCTRSLPERLYRVVTPVDFDESQSALSAIRARGGRADDVRRIVISHFHGDHIGALEDFPRADLIYGAGALDELRQKSKVGALMNAFLPGLLPPDFESRAVPLRGNEVPLPPSCAPFSRGIDVLGDRTLVAVPLPGHARGQLGLFVETDPQTLLVADAAYVSESFERPVMPHAITRLLFDDTKAYERTLHDLHAAHRNPSTLRIIPSHCARALRDFGAS